MKDLEELRAELAAVDEELLGVVRKRAAVVEEIGRAKAQTGRATRDFAQERVVLERARARARSLGVPEGVAEQLQLTLIRASLTRQETQRIRSSDAGGGRSAVVLGGLGKMGGWFAGFLATQGFDVTVVDPKGELKSHEELELDHDLVVVATPLHSTNEVLHELAVRKPKGLVMEVASLKTPLRTGLRALVDQGVRVVGVHPMFGPDVRLLSGRCVVVVDVGAGRAPEAEALFAPTMASVVSATLDEHDRMMARVLGLSHAVNLAFGGAMSRLEERLGHADPSVGSTTFAGQSAVAARVLSESPELYFAIQAGNEYGLAALDALVESVDALRRVVAEGDQVGFQEIMESGRAAVSQFGGDE